MINFQPVDVCGKTIDHVWFQLLKQVLIYGRPYKKDEGSFAGEEMLELDRVGGTIFEPLQYNESGIRKPLAVTVPGGVDYISGQDQKWWPAAAGIAAYGSNHAGFTVWLKVIFLLNIVR